MTLRVLGRYSSGVGSFEPGQVIDLSPDDEAFLLRDSPGSFTPVGSAADLAPVAEPASAPSADEASDDEDEADFDPNVGAMSTETASGLTVPDRRARGGRRRSE